jgi:hypothetical protein
VPAATTPCGTPAFAPRWKPARQASLTQRLTDTLTTGDEDEAVCHIAP